MVSIEGKVFDFASFGERSEADVVVLVEIGGVKLLNLTVGVELLEPCCLLWVNHGVLLEHDKHGGVQAGESLLSQSGSVAVGGLLVVHGWEEDAVPLISGEVVHVSEVACWTNPVLGEAVVNELLGNSVDDAAEDTADAVGDGVDSHMWTTDGQHISDFSLHVALLDDVSGQESALRETDDVEFALEVGVGSDLFARILGDGLEVTHDFTRSSALDAMNWSTCSLCESLIDLLHSCVSAGISETVEHGSRDSCVTNLPGFWVLLEIGISEWRASFLRVLVAGHKHIETQKLKNHFTEIESRVIGDGLITVSKVDDTPAFVWFLYWYRFVGWRGLLEVWFRWIWSIHWFLWCFLIEYSIFSFDVVASVDTGFILRKCDCSNKK